MANTAHQTNSVQQHVGQLVCCLVLTQAARIAAAQTVAETERQLQETAPRRQREQEERRRKEQEDADAELARRLQARKRCVH